MTITDPDVIVEQDQKKYLATNPVVRRLIASWLGQLTDLVDTHVPAGQAFLDAGAGAGFSLAGFAADRPVIAADLHLSKVSQIHERVPQASLVTADVTRLPVPDGAVGWATSIEVLEHVPSPELLVAELARVCRDGVIVSVPWEPWFRLGNLARGKNVSRFGNDPEHIGQFRSSTLARLLETSFTDVTVTRRLPWLLAVATGPRPARR